MAAGSTVTPAANGTHDTSKPIELALNLPQVFGICIHLQITVMTKSILIFLTSTSADSGSTSAAMGSFVYAMPDVSIHGREAGINFKFEPLTRSCIFFYHSDITLLSR